MRRAAGPLALAALATAAAAFLAPVSPAAAPSLFLGYVASLAACAAWWLLRRDTSAEPAGDDVMSSLRRMPVEPPPSPPARLRDLERVIGLGLSSALDAQARLIPELRQLACALLATRHGVELDPAGDDVAGRAGLPGEPLLGPRPRRRPEFTEPGPSAAEVGRVIDRLEMI
jgi:hypothetical protein